MKIPEGIYRLEEPGMAAFLFSGRREVMADALSPGNDGMRLWDRRRHGFGSSGPG